MDDISALSERELLAWAKTRIDADTRMLVELGKQAGVLTGGQTIARGLNFELGIVMLRDLGSGSVFAIGPPSDLVGQTGDGIEHLWRAGEAVYAMVNPAAGVDDGDPFEII